MARGPETADLLRSPEAVDLGDGEAVRDSETAELARLADVAGLESARRRAAELERVAWLLGDGGAELARTSGA